MSIYNAIANQGRNTGAGLNAFAQGKYMVDQQNQQNALAAEEKQYQRGRDQIGDQQNALVASQKQKERQLAYGQETLAMMAAAGDPAKAEAVFDEIGRAHV